MSPIQYAGNMLDVLQIEFPTQESQPSTALVEQIKAHDRILFINFDQNRTPSQRLALLARAYFQAQSFESCAEYGLSALARKQYEIVKQHELLYMVTIKLNIELVDGVEKVTCKD